MDDMEEIDLGPYMPGFMNDGGDRVVEQQAPEQHDIQGNDEQEHMAAYEMLGPYMRAAGALMELEPFGEFSEGENNANEGHEMSVNEGHEMAIAALEQQDTQGIEQQQKEPHASAVEDTTNKGQHLLGRMMAYLTLIINLQAACRRFIQRAKDKNVRSFEESPGTRKQKDGQRKATETCKCCPATRFGEESQDGTWPFDLGRAAGWKNPISMRLSTMEFEKACRDHVGSKNGRHRFWETVERVDKMATSGSGSLSQQDRENLAAGGKILGKLQKYEESWKDYEKNENGGKEIKDYEKQKKRVMTKFEQARRVLEKLQIEIRPLPKKRKAPPACAASPKKRKAPAACAASLAPQTRAEQLAKMEELRAQNQRLMALVAAVNAVGNAQTARRSTT